MNRPKAARYITTISGVHEVTLVGVADAEFWRRRLAREHLFPALIDGNAQLAVGGTALRWLGLRFRELTISAGVSSSPRGDTLDGWFLAIAFNSSPLLAALERGMFSTPYRHASLRVQAGRNASVELRDAAGPRLEAVLGGHDRIPQHGESWWHGRIYLPRAGSARTGRYFCAGLGGPQTSYAWNGATDRLTLPRPDDPLTGLLSGTRFEPLEWRISTASVHSRSRTLVLA